MPQLGMHGSQAQRRTLQLAAGRRLILPSAAGASGWRPCQTALSLGVVKEAVEVVQG